MVHLILRFQLIQIDTPELHAQAFSYLPPPSVNYTVMSQPNFLEDRIQKQPVKKNGIENRWMCWGTTPESIALVSFLSNYSASRSAICGITNEERVVCMGKVTTAYHYALNSVSGDLPPQVKTEAIPLDEIYQRVAVGETFACALQRKSREFTCWGKNIPGRFQLQRTHQDKCGSLWYYRQDQIDKSTFGVNSGIGGFENDFHSSNFDDIVAGSYHLCGYTSSTTTLKCVGYFKGGTRTCTWYETYSRRKCRKWGWWTVRCWNVYWDV